MTDYTGDERRNGDAMTKAMLSEHHKRLRDVEEFLHFGEEVSPAEHVTFHKMAAQNSKRKADNQAVFVRTLIFAATIFLIGLIGMGAKLWILQ